MEIFLTRHGQTDWNVERRIQGQSDTELNKTGIEQVQITAEKLKNEKIDIIVASPLKRARKTAEIINEVIKCPIVFDSRLKERDFGILEGKLITEFDYEGFWSFKKILEFENAENINVFFERIYKTLDDIIEKYKDKNVLIVAHGGVSIPVSCYFNGIPDKETLKDISLHNCEVAKFIK